MYIWLYNIIYVYIIATTPQKNRNRKSLQKNSGKVLFYLFEAYYIESSISIFNLQSTRCGPQDS